MTSDLKLQNYLKEAQKFFPGIYSSSSFSMYNPELQSEPTSGEIELSGQFINDKTLKEGSVQFIHYTSLTSAMNILNSGNVRLYNCLNLNDPSEIKNLLDQSPIEFSPEEIEQYKHEHFILSGCLFSSQEDEDFNSWRLYGDDNKGVGIVFEVNDTLKNWRNIYLQKVDYHSDNANLIYDYLNFHKEFNEEHHLFQNKPDFFPLLATGVKNEIWSIENEFRMVIHTPFDPYSLKPKNKLTTNPLISDTLQHEFKPDGKLVSFVEIPLHLKDRQSKKINLPISQKKVDIINYVPNLRIKKIILGPNSPFRLRSDFMDYEHWIKSKLNYDFEVRLSEIKL